MTLQAALFQSVFGDQWASLPPVMHLHYANRPFTRDVAVAEGRMKVVVSAYARLLSPFMRVFGALVPFAGDDVPTVVAYESEPQSAAFFLNRMFYFKGRAPYRFRSRMEAIGGNEVVEFMPPGIGWHAAYRWNGQKVLLEHKGYQMKLFGRRIAVPWFTYLMGRGYAEEEATGPESFKMYMEIRHPWFGLVYSYSGDFVMKAVDLDA